MKLGRIYLLSARVVGRGLWISFDFEGARGELVGEIDVFIGRLRD